MSVVHNPLRVIPQPLARVVADSDYWFVIGGHAVRCFAPYRPSRDVDFGVRCADDAPSLLADLERSGHVEVLERSDDTIHLTWDGLNVSVFVLPKLVPFVEQQRLSVTGILATKLHAILDRGARRDFFDLYVTLQHHSLGIVQVLSALRQVYGDQVRNGLLLRALTYFEDAEREAPLPGEGRDDWSTVKQFFLDRVGQLLVPPTRVLDIQTRVVDLAPEPEG